MFDAILLKLVGLIIKYSFKKLERNYKILKLLDNRNLLNLQEKPEFDFVYSRTLIEYGMDKKPSELLYLFALKEVKEAFYDETYKNKSGEFLRIADAQLHTNNDKKIRPLKEYFQAKDLPNEIEEFKQTYDYITKQTATPFQLKKYNEDKKFQFEILEKNYKNSFPYQAEKYMKHLITEFKREFPQNRYITQKGKIIEKYKYILPRSKHTLDIFAGETINKYKTKPLTPINKYINTWINDDSQNFLAIMGEYGTGKTSLCKHLAKELADSYFDKKTKIINDKNKRIVFLFNLRNFKAENVEDYIYAFMMRNKIRDFGDPDLYNRIDNKELIFIFDGFDEMTLKIDKDEKIRNFNQIQKLIDKRKNSKVILTSREEYFTSDTELNKIFSIEEKDNYELVYLNLFDKEQIKAYLTAHTKNPDYYLKEFKRIYDLEDLAQRPVLLNFIIKYLPGLIEEKGRNKKINASDLYKTGIEKEMERLKDKIPDIDKKIKKKKRLELLQKLAIYLYENDTFIIDTKLMKKVLNLQKFFNVDEEDERKYLNDFLNFTFLSKESDDIYRISHKSFRDYLVATELVKEINTEKINVFGKHQTSTEINHFISEIKPDRKRLVQLVKAEPETTDQTKWQKSNTVNIILKMDNPEYKGNKDFNKNEINLKYSNLSNISIFLVLKNITMLTLDHNHNINLEMLKELIDLSELYLAGNRIRNIELLKELKKVTKLYLDHNQITNLDSLKELKNLTDLDLRNNQIIFIEPLKKLENLARLYLSDNQITELEPLKELNNLTQLCLQNNQITNLEPLKELRNLNELVLYNNQITNLEPLKELKNLIGLSLSGNKITDLEPLKELKKLTELRLWNNKITDLEPLKKLEKLVYLNLSENLLQKSQIAELKKYLPKTDIRF